MLFPENTHVIFAILMNTFPEFLPVNCQVFGMADGQRMNPEIAIAEQLLLVLRLTLVR